MFVLDTNILVAALQSRNGASFRLIERALEGRLRYAVSVALALEYEAVLLREGLRINSWASAHELDILLDALLAGANRIMPIRTRLRPTLADPGDEMVLECAVQAGADVIVTMNIRDFMAGSQLFRIDIMRPGEALARIEKEEEDNE